MYEYGCKAICVFNETELPLKASLQTVLVSEAGNVKLVVELRRLLITTTV